MASLISANEFENLYAQQREAQQPTLMQGGALNPAMMLQAAHQLRQQQAQRSMTPPGGPPGAGPMAQHVAAAKYKAALGKAYGLGEDDLKDFKDVMDDPSVTPQMMHQLFAAKAATAKGHHPSAPQQAVNPNAGTVSIAAAGHNPAQQQTREAMWGAHQQGLNPQAVPGGFQVGGLGPQTAPQADPVAGMLNAFKGKVPDHMLGAAQQAIQAGVPAANVYNHLMQTAGKQQPDDAGKQRHTEFSENKSVLDELGKQEAELRKRAELDPDPNIQKDLQAVAQQRQAVRSRMEQAVTPQQGESQGQPVQIQSPDEAAKLPAGAQFVFNGHIYRKK